MKPVFPASHNRHGLGTVASASVGQTCPVCPRKSDPSVTRWTWVRRNTVEDQDDSAVQIWASDNMVHGRRETMIDGMACVTEQGSKLDGGDEILIKMVVRLDRSKPFTCDGEPPPLRITPQKCYGPFSNIETLPDLLKRDAQPDGHDT